MKTSKKGIELIKRYEGFVGKPYLDAVGIPTIGYGATHYGNGIKVKMTDKPITEEEATILLSKMLVSYEETVNRLVTRELNKNQFDALVSFTYNLGGANLKSSTLLKKVNANPCDRTIADEFNKWVNAGGKKLNGLVKRRKEEAKLYFS